MGRSCTHDINPKSLSVTSCLVQQTVFAQGWCPPGHPPLLEFICTRSTLAPQQKATGLGTLAADILQTYPCALSLPPSFSSHSLLLYLFVARTGRKPEHVTIVENFEVSIANAGRTNTRHRFDDTRAGIALRRLRTNSTCSPTRGTAHYIFTVTRLKYSLYTTSTDSQPALLTSLR